MALLNFKFGVQTGLPATKAPGTVYITKDTKKLFVDNPTDGSTERVCLGDFQLVSWTKSTSVTTPATALSNHSLKDANTLYITVESSTGATAMWRYVDNTTGFKAISNSEEIAEIIANIEALQTAVSALNTFKDTTVPNTYMSKAGGTFTGNVAMASGAALTVNTPSANGHAATKKYVDDAKSALLGNSSATTTTNATIYDVKRAAEAAAAAASSAATAASKANANADGRVSKAGDTMTGALTLSGAPTADLHAATKAYVDSAKTSAINTAAGDATNKANAVLGTSNDDADDVTVYGAIAKAGAAASAASSANDNANNRVAKSGDTMTGFLTLHAAPTNNLHAATKKYVDDAKSSAISTAAGDATAKANAVLGTSSDDANANTVYGAKAAASAAATTANNAMPKAGGTFTGNVAMGSGKTLTVNTPSADGHAATKAYVDTAASTAKTGAESTAQGYVNALKGTSADGADAVTVYGAIAKAGAAATAASNAQATADAALPKAGGTMSGFITLHAAPTADAHAATKKYVDTAKSSAISTVQGASTDTKDSTTVIGAKKYTDAAISSVNSTINTLKDNIGNLSNIMNFLGTTTTEIADGTTTTINKPSAVSADTYTAVIGDVVVDSKGKECVYDGAKWRVIGDTSANSTAITNLQNTVGTKPNSPTMDNTLWDEVADLRSDLGESNDAATKTTAFGRIAALEAWKGTHATEYSTLNTTVGNHTTAIGTADDAASASGSLYARIKKNASDISGHNTRITALENWKTSHSTEYSNLAKRVTALETWKGTHTTEFTNLSGDVAGNTTAINNLTTILTWGSF